MLIVILQASSAYDVEDVTICISEYFFGGKYYYLKHSEAGAADETAATCG